MRAKCKLFNKHSFVREFIVIFLHQTGYFSFIIFISRLTPGYFFVSFPRMTGTLYLHGSKPIAMVSVAINH